MKIFKGQISRKTKRMEKSNNFIKRRLNGVLFGFYSPEEIQKMSVAEINSISVFDDFNNPYKNSLHDPRLGVSPYERHASCATCGEEEEHCPGHLGHIQLVRPVYNCFLMNQLYKLLKIKCYSCSKIKLTKFRYFSIY